MDIRIRNNYHDVGNDCRGINKKSEEEFSIIRPSSDRAVVGSVVKVDSSVPSTPDVIMAGLWF